MMPQNFSSLVILSVLSVTFFSFRWDEQKVTDGQRTTEASRWAEGKRLVYQQAAKAG